MTTDETPAPGTGKRDQITILEANHDGDGYRGWYCKDYTPRRKSLPVTKPTRHRVHSRGVDNLRELKNVIEGIRRKPKLGVIRGTLKDDLENDGSVRRQLQNFDDTPHHWAMFDLDQIPIQAGDPDWRREAEACVELIIKRHLPAQLHGAACYWYWSASMGMAGKEDLYRLHCWFWLKDPLSSWDLKRWTLQQGWEWEEKDRKRRIRLHHPVDLAVFQPVQPHMVNKPRFPHGPPKDTDRAVTEGATAFEFDGAAEGSRPALAGAQSGTPLPDRRAGKDCGYIEGGEANLIVDDFTAQALPEQLVNSFDPAYVYAGGEDATFDRVKADKTSFIGFVNEYIPIHEALEFAGYVGVKGRFLYPASTTGTPGVVIQEGHCFSHHPEDPLHRDNCGRAWSDSYDVLEIHYLDGTAGEDMPEDRRLAIAQAQLLDLAKVHAMQKLNEELGVLVSDNKVSIGRIARHSLYPNQRTLKLASKSDMTLLFKNRPGWSGRVEVDTDLGSAKLRLDRVNMVDAWLEWGHRREWEGTTFYPADRWSKAHPHIYNEWEGWPINPKARGNGTWEKFQRLILEGLCAGNEEHATWLLDWMAHLLQHPEQRLGVAIVLRGARGAGKGKFMQWFGERLLQKYFTNMSKMEHLTGSFNAQMVGKLLVFADEAVHAGDRHEEGAIKAMITESMGRVEKKYRDAELAPLFQRFVLASNEEWAAPAGGHERRFFVLDVSRLFLQDHAFFAELDEEMKNGGLEAMAYDLFRREITTNQRKAPHTDALASLAERGLRPHEAWFMDVLSRGEFLRGRYDAQADGFGDDDAQVADYLNGSRWPVWVNPDAIHDDYRFWCQRMKRDRYLESPQQLKNWVGRMLRVAQGVEPGGKVLRLKKDLGNGTRHNVWKWPTVDKFRWAFNEIVGVHVSASDDAWVDHDEEDTGEDIAWL